MGCGFTFHGGIGGEDDFPNLAGREPLLQPIETQLRGPYAVEW